MIINSTISDSKRGARFMSADLKDHFLASPMNRPEYMKIPYKYFPDDIIQKYNLQNKVSNGYEIRVERSKHPGSKRHKR